jgi:biotin carboxylase
MQSILIVSTCCEDALRAAKHKGLRVLLMYDAEVSLQGENIDNQIWIDPHDIGCREEAIAQLKMLDPLSGVLTFDERAVPMAAAISEALGLPGNTYKSAYSARNKFVMRKSFADHGIPCPRFAIADTIERAKDIAQQDVGFPLVVKPLFGSVGQGVVRVDRNYELASAFEGTQLIARSYEYFVKTDIYRDYVLLEEYMEGRELSVDGVIDRGKFQWIGIFDKPNPLCGPTFEETIITTPSLETPEVQMEVLDMAERGARALGLRHGPVHAELRLTDNGPRILEIAARPIGGLCGRAHSFCLGIDYYEVMISNALGQTVQIPHGDRVPAGVMMLPVPKPGRLSAINGVQEARRVDGVRDVVILARPGDIVRSFPQQGWYIGFILATGASPREVQATLNESHSLLQFEFDELDEEMSS